MIRQVDTRRLVFAALPHNKTLPNIPDFGGEFGTRDAPTGNGRTRSKSYTVNSSLTGKEELVLLDLKYKCR